MSVRGIAGRRPGSTDILGAVLFGAVALKLTAPSVLSTPAIQAWATVFAAICIQATPFLALGVLLSTVIAVLVPASFLAAALPRRNGFAVPIAALAGGVLPGCECGSVPVARALMSGGVTGAPAVAFLLAAPAINPVVLTATAVAFPGRPAVVVARLLASLGLAVTVGWLWQRLGRDVIIRPRQPIVTHGTPRWTHARLAAAQELAQALGLLAIGAAGAATLSVSVPRSGLDGLGRSGVLGALTLAGLAVLIAVCSEADAYIASSLTQFSLTARLTFMVVGPAIDLKLLALQIGTFGWAFARRFAPLCFLVAVALALLVGAVVL